MPRYEVGISPPGAIGNWPAQAEKSAQVVTVNCWESLEDWWRTANAKLGKFKPGLGQDVFFLKQTDRGENGCGVAGNNGGSGAMRHHADRAGVGFRLCRVIVGRLGGHRPQ